MIPLIVVLTILTGLVTIVGSWVGGGRVWGYWPPHIWSRLCMWLTLATVEVRGRGNIPPETSCVFVANHQGAYDMSGCRPDFRRQLVAGCHPKDNGQGREDTSGRYVGGSVPRRLAYTDGTHGAFPHRCFPACPGVSASSGTDYDRRRLFHPAAGTMAPSLGKNRNDHP